MLHLDDERFIPLLAALTLERKVALLTGQDSWSLHALPEIGLSSIVLSDGPVGVRGASWDERLPSINFPSPTALAASWDPEQVKAVGSGIGSEARRKGVHAVLAPTINLQRTPYGGRHFEAFSEDPLLTAAMAVAYVAGVQEHGVGATVKHYVANDSETDRFTVDVRVSERALRELYLLPFERAVVEAGSWLVMSAYNSINGATASENDLLTSPLSDEWGFDGVVVSDWTAVRSLESARHPQDLAMPGPAGPWGEALVDAVRDGTVAEEAVDRKVTRILKLAARVGALEGFEAAPRAVVSDVESLRLVARTAAAEGMVLLQNRGVLPLQRPDSFAVIGEGARSARTQGGGSATVIPAHTVSPLQGVRDRWPSARVTWTLGAVVQSGIADLEPGSYATTGGEPGLTVRYFNAGSLLLEERREASSITSFDQAALAARSDLVEMEFVYTNSSQADTAPFAVAGVCDYEILVDDVPLQAGELRTALGDDFSTAVLNPPFASASIPVRGSARITVRFRPIDGGVPDALTLRVGVPPLEADPAELIEQAVANARASDVAIVVVSTSSDVESEGFDRTSLRLPGRQDDLVRAVAAANPRTIVIVNSGAPVLLPWRDDVPAILVAWFPGQEFGAALADVLAGDREPGGRLPVTWPAVESHLPVRDVLPLNGKLDYVEGIHIGYRAWLKERLEPAYPFGHGLGYTDFAIQRLESSAWLGPEGGAVVAVEVTNTGNAAGKVVVQLYLERGSPSTVERPVRWLAGFLTARLGAGESRTLTTTLDWRQFAHWDAGWVVEPGTYGLTAGLSSSDARVTTSVLATMGAESADENPADVGSIAL